MLGVQRVDKVVDVPAAQVSQFFRRRWLRQPSPTVAIVENSSISYEPFFDKVADMPVVVQSQSVDKVVDLPACRACSFQGARRGEDSPYPTVAGALRKIARDPQSCSSRFMVDVPCYGRSCMVP